MTGWRRPPAEQLRPHGVTPAALHPGLVRTEGVMRFADHLDLSSSQSAEGVGCAIAALAADLDRVPLSGRIQEVTALAARYGIDVSG
jgi:hypothetical protein